MKMVDFLTLSDEEKVKLMPDDIHGSVCFWLIPPSFGGKIEIWGVSSKVRTPLLVWGRGFYLLPHLLHNLYLPLKGCV